MPKQIDPIERALDAYVELDTDQRVTFHMVVARVERMLGTGHSVDYCKPQDETKRRGRPTGSRNRAKLLAHSQSVSGVETENIDLVEKLFGNNGAATEGL